MKIIFMGTPDFAVESLEALIAAGYEVVLAVTQPDKPKGRSGALQFPPVKECAISHDIPVFQPERVRRPEAIETLQKYQPDLIVVAAFGQILPKEILEMPRFGCINVHASLLPKYRGAAPIQWAVINGDETAGVTIMRMDVGLDTGDMISKVKLPLAIGETAGTLFDKLSKAGADLLVQTIPDIVSGKAVYTPQTEAEATHTTMIQKSMGQINWASSAVSIERLIRGMNPWPSAYTSFRGKTIKIWKACVCKKDALDIQTPGTVVKVTKSEMYVQTGDGVLIIEEVQPEGKKRMSTDAFLRGNQVSDGEILG